jgi:hypothetical protein
MLGESHAPKYDVYSKGISALLPPIQKAPENNSGEFIKRDKYAIVIQSSIPYIFIIKQNKYHISAHNSFSFIPLFHN